MKYLIKPGLYTFLLFFILFSRVAKPTNLWDNNIISECVTVLTSPKSLLFLKTKTAIFLGAISGRVLRGSQETAGVLENILETSANISDTVAIFDLSSTLFRVSPRIINAFKEFAQNPTLRFKVDLVKKPLF